MELTTQVAKLQPEQPNLLKVILTCLLLQNQPHVDQQPLTITRTDHEGQILIDTAGLTDRGPMLPEIIQLSTEKHRRHQNTIPEVKMESHTTASPTTTFKSHFKTIKDKKFSISLPLKMFSSKNVQ